MSPRPRRGRWPATFLLVALLAPSAGASDRDDLVVADFEGETWAPWSAEGDAFGPGPARGAWPGQMGVGGYLGKGLVNSLRGGDDSTGILTSPPTRVERPRLNFLIGGGKYPGETCLDLLLDGRVVRTATGPNDRPGGSEQLEWAGWDVGDLMGREVVLRVTDRRKGGWGHINVDQIVQSDRPRGVVEASREIAVTSRYLHLPVDPSATLRRVKVSVDGQVARDFDIKLAEGEPSFRSFLDLAPFRDRTLKVEARLPADSKALEGIAQGAEAAEASGLYREPGRPQFHFTSRRGWLNDPNGLVWMDGEYHLFYQHNPYGWDWGNMHWGHAVSRDLVRWAELPISLYPRRYGDWAFSGSAVVDRENTAGFGPAGSSPMVAAYTSTGRGECIIYSLDRGRTWAEYAGNPVVKHDGRDPRLFRHAPTGRWGMAVFDEADKKRSIMFHSSPDLKAWTYESKIDDFYECPDIFELPVRGPEARSYWVLLGADGRYLLGRFDGKVFRPESGKHQTWFGNFYASQTFSDEPGGRRIQVGWAQGIAFPGMPFNQQMNVPVELTLRPTAEGVRLFAEPVAELATLRTKHHAYREIAPGSDPLSGLSLDLFDARVEADLGAAGTVTLDVPGAPVVYDATRATLSCGGVSAPLLGRAGVIRFRVLVDRASVEVFGEEGRVAISKGRSDRTPNKPVGLSVTGKGSMVRTLEVDELGSAWR